MEQKIHLAPKESSIIQGDNLKLSISGITFAKLEGISYQISKVDKDYTQWTLSASTGEICLAANSIDFTCSAVAKLGVGLYIISQLKFNDNNKDYKLTKNDFGICLFEIRDVSAPSKSAYEIFQEYDQILRARNEDFLKGFGHNFDEDGVKEFTILVFVKDCLLGSPRRFGQCEVIPFEHLTCMDEVNLINQFLHSNGLPAIAREIALELSQCSQPTLIIHFPKIFAQSANEAAKIAEDEGQLITHVLALHRGSYGSIIGSYIIEKFSGKVHVQLNKPRYMGNILTGPGSGEDPESIKNYIINSRNNPRLQLYLLLYGEALSENRWDFLYFKYWNILEMAARSKDYIGRPLCDWRGNIIYNNEHKVRKIQDDAKELVFELLREDLSNHYSETSFSFNLKQGKISELIQIWYRHRNCVVHRGACTPNDATFCSRTDLNILAARMPMMKWLNLTAILTFCRTLSGKYYFLKGTALRKIAALEKNNHQKLSHR